MNMKFDKDKKLFKDAIKDFKSIKFSTKEQFLKKLPRYLPGSIMCAIIGYYMLHIKLDNLIAQSIQGTIPVILFIISGITLISLIFNVTVFDEGVK